MFGLWVSLSVFLWIAGCAKQDETGEAHPGLQVYSRYCFSCHQGGVAGSPMLGDEEAWAPRIAKGRPALLQSVKEGIPPGMPVMGLCNSCTDAELDQAIDYMVKSADAGP